ncbi:MAG: hypothetical protein KDD53_10425, partial [Bdellovibrionales bacterium]|nr:hypothetical protein [Bdellovibrionales bacterium]
PASGLQGVGDASRFVNTATGKSSYAVPLSVPHGRAGLTPSIALVYGSSTSRSHVGAGWQIGGLGKIERFGPRYGTPRHLDDAATLDFYTLSLPGLSGKLIQASPGVFYTEKESFLKITSDAGGWTVRARNGHTYKFLHKFGEDTWVLTQILDRFGNTIDFTWDSDGGKERIKLITYAGRSIEFQYDDHWEEERPDKLINFERGRRVVMATRLRKILVHSPSKIINGLLLGYNEEGASPATQYPDITNSFLTSIQVLGNNGTPSTAEPFRFTYSMRQPGWQESSEWQLPFPILSHTKNSNDPSVKTLHDLGVRFGDVNGDGLLDLVVSAQDPANPADGDFAALMMPEEAVFLNNGSGWNESPEPYTFPRNFSRREGDLGTYFFGGELKDLDSDGKVDANTSYHVEHTWVNASWLNNGAGWDEERSDTNPVAVGKRTYPTGQWDYGTRDVNLNNDGIPDLLKLRGTIDSRVNPPEYIRAEDAGLYLNLGDGYLWEFKGDVDSILLPGQFNP